MQMAIMNWMPDRCRSAFRKGFTLVEVILAILILAVLALGGGAFIYHSRMNLMQQVYKRAAIMSANDKMEWLMRLETYDAVKNRIGNVETNSVSLNGSERFGRYYVRTTTVSNGVDNCLDVTVRVQYAGPNEVVSLRTLRSK